MANPLDSLAGFLGRHDHYVHYRTRREAAFARGTVAGLLLALLLRALWLLADYAVAGGSFGRLFVLPLLGSATACLLPGVLLGSILALRQPRWMPVAGSLTPPLACEFPTEAVEEARRTWEREDGWYPLDGVLRSGRAPQDRLGITEGSGPLESIVAAENMEAAENSFACTTWYGPCDPRNAVWYSPRRETFSGTEPDLDGFRGFFSDEAVQARWDSLPEKARELAGDKAEELLVRARDYARGRLAALDALGEAAAGIPMLAARGLTGTPGEFASFLLLHEAGHLRLAAWCASPARYVYEGRRWDSAIGKALLAAQPVPVSLYSLVGPGEWLAEHYAAWRTRPGSVTPETGRLMQAIAYREPLPE